RSGRARHLTALAGSQLDVVNLRAQRDIDQRQRIARKNVGVGATHDFLADFQTRRRDDVALLAVQISNQRDMSRAIRIVFDLRNTSGHAFLVALKVDNSIKALVTAATTPHGNTAVVVTSGNPLLWLEQ